MRITKYFTNLVNLICLFFGIYIIFPNYLSFTLGPIELSLDRIVFIVLFLYWIYGLLLTTSVGSVLRKRMRSNRKIFSLFLLFFIVQGFLIFYSTDFNSSIKRYSYFFLYNFIPFLIIFSIPYDYFLFRRIAKSFVISIGLILCISVFELIIGNNPFSFFVDVSSLNEFQQGMLTARERAGGRRIQASFVHPLTFGHFVIFFIPILFYFKKTYLRKGNILNFIAAGLVMVSIFIRSRMVTVILVIAALYAIYYFLFLTKSKIHLKILFLLTSSLLGTLILPLFNMSVITDFFGGHEFTSDNSRAEQIALAIPLLEKNIISGYGFGEGVEALNFGTSGGGNGTIDNYFLTLILDSGVIVLIIYFLLLITIMFKYFSVSKENKIFLLSFLFFILNLFTLSISEIHPYFYFFLGFFLIHISKEYREADLLK